MKRMFKTILSYTFTLALLLVIGLAPLTGSSAHADTEGSSPDGQEQLVPRVSGYAPVDINVNKVGGKKRGGTKRTFEPAYRSDKQTWANGIRVRDQKTTGLCWAFAVATSAEYSYAKETYNDENYKFRELSPGHLGYFSFNRVPDPLGNTDGDANHSEDLWVLNGGAPLLTMQHLATWSGVAREFTAPFGNIMSVESGSEDQFNLHPYSDILAYEDHLTLQNSIVKKPSESEAVDTIKGMVKDYGAATIALYVDAYDDDVNYFSWDYYAHYDYEGTKGTNHVVTIVGWDDSFPKENFRTTPEGDGAWIIQNSWGNAFDNGYFYVSYYSKDACVNPYVIAYDMQPAATYDYNFQYDGTMDCGDSSDDGNEDFYTAAGTEAANVFTNATGRPISLEAVGMTTFNDGSTDYTIDIYTGLTDEGDPTSGTLAGTTTASTDTMGVKTIPLDEPVTVERNETYSIVFSFDDDTYFGVEKDREYESWYDFEVEVDPGQSFFKPSDSDAWEDMYDYDACFRIKGFATALPISIQDAEVVLGETSFTYNGAVQQPDVVTVGGEELTPGTDYTVTVKDSEGETVSPKDAGTYTIEITGTGIYEGVTSGTFVIAPKSIDPVVEVSPASYSYDGKVKTPSVTVRDGEALLEENRDYSVTFAEGRIKPGTYSVAVTLKGNYEGAGEGTFTIKEAIVQEQSIYRLYNPKTKEHLYTSAKKEYDTLPSYGWKQEGVGWYAPKSGTAVYRLYNKTTKDHHYTASANEAKVLTTQYGWVYDNNARPVFYSGGKVDIYRLYNPKLKIGAHHLTKNRKEYDTLPSYGWRQEGATLKAIR